MDQKGDKMTSVKLGIEKLRQKMKDSGIDYFLMTSSDFHASEYVGGYFKVTEFFSGCTSDNVTLIAGAEETKLWTDGRYFISAAKELDGSGIELMRMGEPGVPTAEEFLRKALAPGMTLAFDGRCVDAAAGCVFEGIADQCGASLKTDTDPAEAIWKERPALPSHPVFIVPDEIAGVSFAGKLADVRSRMKEEGASYFMLSKLDDINWLLNIRGNDVFCNPVALSYVFIGMDSFDLFIQDSELTDKFRAYAGENRIVLHPYDQLFDFLEAFDFHGNVMAEKSRISYRVLKTLEKKTEIVFCENPTEQKKAMKNPVEAENSRKYYLLDSVALCRFICWFKKNAGKEKITELSAAKHLDRLREEIPGYIELSFPTISAYGENAAMAHYAASAKSDKTVEDKGFLLVDSGGQYMGGTTDVTRTMAAGTLTDEMKRDFTLVAVSNLALLNARFLYGCTGKNLDTYARAPLWEYGINYNHGTGHGIGYILNVHEGPQNIRWKYSDGQKEAVIEKGMIVSDEPGIYIEGKYGIRTETILFAREDIRNEYGQFMCFEPLTYAPIDLAAIDTAYMQPKDIERLNNYHALVWEKISPYLEGEELEFLKNATRAI